MKTVYAALPIVICPKDLEHSHQTACPFCGRLCYDTPLTQAAQQNGAAKACTICALENGAGVWTDYDTGMNKEPTNNRRTHI